MISASIVTYNTDIIELKKCIDSMINDGVDKIYISDNSVKDTLRSFCSDYDMIEYIFNNANMGYGAAHNVAIKKAIAGGAEYHLVINSDVYFDRGAVPSIVQYMNENQDVAMVQPNVVYPDGEMQYTVRLLPTPMNLIFRRFMPKSMVERMNYRYLLKFNDHKQEMNIAYHQGSFMFFRAKCFEKVGLFDERFFMYPEDIDITRRMHKYYRTMFYPSVTITHAHRAASYKSKKMLKIHMENMIKYFNKWGWFFDKERSKWNQEIIKNYSQN